MTLENGARGWTGAGPRKENDDGPGKEKEEEKRVWGGVGGACICAGGGVGEEQQTCGWGLTWPEAMTQPAGTLALSRLRGGRLTS